MKKDFSNTSPNEQRNVETSEHDSILGCMLFESFCGAALGELAAEAMDVPEWARELDHGNALEVYEEFRRDRANGGFELGGKSALNGTFNDLGIFSSQNDDKPTSPSHTAYEAASRGLGSFITASAPALL